MKSRKKSESNNLVTYQAVWRRLTIACAIFALTILGYVSLSIFYYPTLLSTLELKLVLVMQSCIQLIGIDFGSYQELAFVGELLWMVVGVLLGIGIIYSFVKVCVEYIYARKEIGSLKLESKLLHHAGESITYNLFRSTHPYAFMFGVIRPQIYISTSLEKSLGKEELLAVLLHEKAHIHSGDQLRLLLLRWLRNLFFWMPGAERFYNNSISIMESASDEYVVANGITSMTLAQAIVKAVEGRKLSGVLLAFRGGMVGEVSRVSNLVGKDTPHHSLRFTRVLIFTFFSITLLLISFTTGFAKSSDQVRSSSMVCVYDRPKESREGRVNRQSKDLIFSPAQINFTPAP